MRRNMVLANQDIRAAAVEHGLFLWQVAKRAGIAPTTLTMWLRTPVTPEQHDLLMKAIEGEGGGTNGTEAKREG